MSTKIKGCELDIRDRQLLGGYVRISKKNKERGSANVSDLPSTNTESANICRGILHWLLTGVKSGLKSGETIVLQHMKEGSLSSVIETEEENLCVLVEQAYR